MAKRQVDLGEKTFPMESIPLEEIDVRSFRNSRTKVKPEQIDALKESILQRGLLQSPIVRRKSLKLIDLQEKGVIPGDSEKGYEVISGFQRILALMKIYNESTGSLFFEVTVGVADVDDAEARKINLSENLHRRNLSFADESEALYELESSGLTSQQLAEHLGVKRSWVAQRLSFRKYAEKDLVRVVEIRVLPFSRAYQIFRQLGGSKPSRSDRIAQRNVAKAAIKANTDYMEKVSRRLERLSEKKRGIIAGKAAQEEAQRHQLKKRGRGSQDKALVYSQATEIISHLRTRFLADGELSQYDRGVMDAFLALTGGRGAPDLYGRYIVTSTMKDKRKGARKAGVCQEQVLSRDQKTKGEIPTICGAPLSADSDSVYCSAHGG